MYKLVTIATYENSFQAKLMKAKLHAAGIESNLIGDNIISFRQLSSDVAGTIRLQVLERDVQDATLIINDEE